MSEKIPSKWVALVVEYGERGQHLIGAHDKSPQFFATEDDAEAWARRHCTYDQEALVAIMKIDRLMKAAEVTFETITS